MGNAVGLNTEFRVNPILPKDTVTVANDDLILISDTSDSGALKKVAASDLGGGGGGSVTSVAVTGSDGVEVDSGSPITSSGTIALGVNKTTLLSHINVSDGATANAKATGAELDTATDDAKFATAKALKDSHNVPSVAP